MTSHPDAIIVGSGFGGALAAHVLVERGLRVLMLERGDWVTRGPHNWEGRGSITLTPVYSPDFPYVVDDGRRARRANGYACVGGPSVFYGGVSLRLRVRDFERDPELAADPGTRWPLRYGDLEPYYTRAEALLDVAGETGADPSEPPRSAPFPQPALPLAAVSSMIADGARALGLHPFRLPLAINYGSDPSRPSCVKCGTCDTFACAIEAKNDLAARILAPLVRKGLEIRPSAVVTRIDAHGDRVTAVEVCDRRTLARDRLHAGLVVLAAGALASPHLLLASDLQRVNPAGALVGGYLTRHCSGIVFGFFRALPGEGREFHKQLGVHDFYFGHAGISEPRGRLGSIQQVPTPPVGLMEAEVPWPVGRLLRPAIKHMTGLLVLAEDQPLATNRVVIDRAHTDRFGTPMLRVHHRYTQRDLAARRVLFQRSRAILRASGAKLFYTHVIHTFSHAIGTVRMGDDPALAPLDPDCRFRGLQNLYVVDGSSMPTGGAVNPSLTIAANALRVAEGIAA